MKFSPAALQNTLRKCTEIALNTKKIAPAAPFFASVEYHKRENRVCVRKQEDFPLCRAPQAKILHIGSDNTYVLPYKMGAAGDFLRFENATNGIVH